MQDLNDKINDGGATADGQLSASEWNQLPSEIQNAIESAGITLSGSDLTQLVKSIAQYAVVGQFATGGGIADAYTAVVIAPAIAPPALKNGMIVRTIISNTNTGASTLNAFGLGVIDIKLKGGVTNPSVGDLTISKESVFTYRTSPSAHWELTSKISGGLKSVQVFTATGASTWTKPSGISKIKVINTGAGGSGAGSAVSESGSAGGAGATAIKLIDVTAISSETVTVGAGATGGAIASNGTSGGTSSFGAHCSSTGGAGGAYSTATDLGGTGGTATGGDINIRGGTGGASNPDNNSMADGGGSYFGGGGPGEYASGVNPAIAYGAGGGGSTGGGVGYTGGNGADGVVIVEEFE